MLQRLMVSIKPAYWLVHLCAKLGIVICFVSPALSVADVNVADMPQTFGVTYRGSIPNSGLNGRIANNIGDFNRDGYDDFAIGSPLDEGGGTVYVTFGHPGQFRDLNLLSVGNENAKGFRITAPANDYGILGHWIDGAGDFNGDGFDDIIISSSGSAAFIVYGRNTGIENLNTDEFQSSNSRGIRLDNFRAYAVAGAGDVNADGFADILLSYPWDAYGRKTRCGKVTVIFGRANSGNIDASTFVTSDSTGFTIQGTNNGQQLGISLGSAGDFNKDGFDDFVVTASQQFYYGIGGTTNYSPGSSFLVYGKPGGYVDIVTKGTQPAGLLMFDAQGLHPEAGTTIGNSSRLADSRDFNGDGYSDVAISSEYEMVNGHGNSGSVFVVYGHPQISSSISLASISENSAGVRINGLPQSYLGSYINFAGDLNNDGCDDLVLIADNSTGPDVSSANVYVVYGRADIIGTISISEATSSRDGGYRILNTNSDQFYAPMPNAAGDVNGDGFDDFLMYYIYDNYPFLNTADTYLMFGSATAPAAAALWSLYD